MSISVRSGAPHENSGLLLLKACQESENPACLAGKSQLQEDMIHVIKVSGAVLGERAMPRSYM